MPADTLARQRMTNKTQPAHGRALFCKRNAKLRVCSMSPSPYLPSTLLPSPKAMTFSRGLPSMKLFAKRLVKPLDIVINNVFFKLQVLRTIPQCIRLVPGSQFLLLAWSRFSLSLPPSLIKALNQKTAGAMKAEVCRNESSLSGDARSVIMARRNTAATKTSN